MIYLNPQFSEIVEALVTDIEEQTDAEIVVVASERSGQYRDIANRTGAFAAFIALAAMLALPEGLHPALVLVNTIATFFITCWFANSRGMLRILASKARQTQQVRNKASAEFYQEAVFATPYRSGILIYVSELEEHVEIIPDIGLERLIAQGLWVPAKELFSQSDFPHFLEGLRQVGTVLAKYNPAVEGNTFNLPNAPRIRH